MIADRWPRVKALFAEVLELPETERTAFLDKACGGDEELRREVEELLAVDDKTMAGTLEIGAPVHAMMPDGPREIGPFRILKMLGQGGMGRVYLAEQAEPVQRRVALKLIRLGMDSEEVLARFEAERRALALMEHDSIAKVFDVGTSDSGQPYFVMEYVPGAPVTDYSDEHELDVRRRLELFEQICMGVQHAHQKGVVHRDLKPSNILVAARDGRDVPKIIDFGIAKAIDQRSHTARQFTRQGDVVGTPDYMSPEQAGPESHDVDTRSDVYSLGVILHELLTGTLPFENRTREQGALRPSTTTDRRTADSKQIARKRGATPMSLSRQLRGDLDWITMKALEWDRDLRYATPVGLAGDVRRHLRNEPVEAGPPGAAYRIRKFVRRFRLQVAAVGAVFLTLLAGMSGTTFFLFKAEANLDKYNLLSAVVRLAEAREVFEEEDSLYPAFPEKIGAMQEWLAKRAEPLEDSLPDLRETLDALRVRALPPSEAELAQARNEHPRAEEFAQRLAKLGALQNALAVRESRAQPEKHEFRRPVPMEADGLNRRAWPLVSWSDDREWGREAEGLALAERAWGVVSTSAASSPAEAAQQARTADTLAWAFFANGLDARALAMAERSLSLWPESERAERAPQLEEMRKHIAAASGEAGRAAIAEVEREVSSLRVEIGKRRSWRFADPSDQFLHDALTDLVVDLRLFVQPERGEIDEVRARLSWAQTVHERTITRYAAAWERARTAIAEADGRTAHELYAKTPVDLHPQIGLVPIGMNPKTRLWEFYHVRSAADPDKIPEHDANGVIPVNESTGIIFVLIPGGTFLMGAQRNAPTKPNYDRDAQPHEMLLGVGVEPFFLARHEMTQAQWKRLSRGDEPSLYPPGAWNRDDDRAGPGTLAHPVENVTWPTSRRLLQQHGLDLPEDPEWEYACRATTSTPWFTGDSAAILVEYGNLRDMTAWRAVPHWGKPEDFDDGYIIHAPVGTFTANKFGLFDTIGNVLEWCRASEVSVDEYIVRGGCYTSAATEARSATLFALTSALRSGKTGLRAARNLRDRPRRAR